MMRHVSKAYETCQELLEAHPRTRVNPDASCERLRAKAIMRHRGITINTFTKPHAQRHKISPEPDVEGFLLAEERHTHGSYCIKIFETRCRYVSCYKHVRRHDCWLLGMVKPYEVIHPEHPA